jgi:hypothetical protein
MSKKIKALVLTSVLTGGAVIGATASTVNDDNLDTQIIDQYATKLVLNNVSATADDDVSFDGSGTTDIVANIDFYASETSKDGENVKAELFNYDLIKGDIINSTGNVVNGTTKVYEKDKLYYAKVN